MVTDSFIAQIKTEGSYEDIAKDAETRFDVSNYELYRPSPKEKNEKVFLLIKDELGGKIMKQSAAQRAKTDSYQQATIMKIKKQN